MFYVLGAMLDPLMFIPVFCVVIATKKHPDAARVAYGAGLAALIAIAFAFVTLAGTTPTNPGMAFIYALGGAIWSAIFIFTPWIWTKPSAWANRKSA